MLAGEWKVEIPVRSWYDKKRIYGEVQNQTSTKGQSKSKLRFWGVEWSLTWDNRNGKAKPFASKEVKNKTKQTSDSKEKENIKLLLPFWLAY